MNKQQQMSRAKKRTAWKVRFWDSLAERVIAIGALTTIAAILLVVCVLISTALPLFRSPSHGQWKTFPTSEFLEFGVDESGSMMWGVDPAGTIHAISLSTGQQLNSFPLADTLSEITCTHVSVDRKTLTLGFSSGEIRSANIEFGVNLLALNKVPKEVDVTADHPVQVYENSVYQWFNTSGVKRIRLQTPTWTGARKLSDGPIDTVDYVASPDSAQPFNQARAVALATSAGELIVADIRAPAGLFPGTQEETVIKIREPLQSRSVDGRPIGVCLLDSASTVLVIWRRGTIDRFQLANEGLEFKESVSATVAGTELTCASPLLGRQTLLTGLADGRVLGWQTVPTARPLNSPDVNSLGGLPAGPGNFQLRLAQAHELHPFQKAVKSISCDERQHLAVTCDTAGNTAVLHITTDDLAVAFTPARQQPISAIGFSPSGGHLVAISEDLTSIAGIKSEHPNASLRTYFGKVWYEGHDRPKYIWQPSSGSEESQAKLSLIPLFFGTLKATFYAMLLSVPLAIAAALFTSEFMSESNRRRIKPVVELMANFPGVILGYVTASIVAPFASAHLASLLLACVLIPLCYYLLGLVWNFFPRRSSSIVSRWQFTSLVVGGPIAIVLSAWAGGWTERFLFGGPMRDWLGANEGSALGGWIVVLVPIVGLLIFVSLRTPQLQGLRSLARRGTKQEYAYISLLRAFLSIVLTLVTASVLANFLTSQGYDLRNTLFTSFQDRNAFLVGLALGFAVIPIIFTISEDALRSVPQHLRDASTASGATPWQTAVRIVVPTAMSGLVSAVMLGAGRAAGETMIILMVAGNTPLLEWNPFNGLKSLSSTLAIELPEASKGTTHFHTLFLAAFLLFAVTLIANSLAEWVRMRFRHRVSQL